jgi:hypothetical protein
VDVAKHLICIGFDFDGAEFCTMESAADAYDRRFPFNSNST